MDPASCDQQQEPCCARRGHRGGRRIGDPRDHGLEPDLALDDEPVNLVLEFDLDAFDATGDEYILSDPANIVLVDPAIAGATQGSDGHEVRVPRTAFTGGLTVNALDGDDTTTVVSLAASLPGSLQPQRPTITGRAAALSTSTRTEKTPTLWRKRSDTR